MAGRYLMPHKYHLAFTYNAKLMQEVCKVSWTKETLLKEQKAKKDTLCNYLRQ
jgi:hypothetical protein